MTQPARGSSWWLSPGGARLVLGGYLVAAVVLLAVVLAGVGAVWQARPVMVLAQVHHIESLAADVAIFRATGGAVPAGRRGSLALIQTRLADFSALGSTQEPLPADIAADLGQVEAIVRALAANPDPVRRDRLARDLADLTAVLSGTVSQHVQEEMALESQRLQAYAATVGGLAVMLLALGFGLIDLAIKLARRNRTLSEMANLDPLTGLANRRMVELQAEAIFLLARRTGRPVALAVLDLDRFKSVNDTFGHLAGDAVLRHVARLIAAQRRASDIVGRMGGEEFVVLMPDTDSTGAARVCETLRQRLEGAPYPQPHGGTIFVTASFGMASGVGETVDFATLYHAADSALYQAKDGGRNRIVTA
ncbi:GGDEF domain-containing protein [Pseudoxanthobacter sp.]|uniref:GGDEF domain-containing protein n=1 Tax=Pseudoxanthobacter sp. TaxID=1925742 RepID=UPI002FE29EC8